MNPIEIILVVFSVILILILYVSMLTGFFALYYYDENLHKKIVISGDDGLGYNISILGIAAFFFLAIAVMVFYKEIVWGLTVFFILLFLAILYRTLVKKNMKNIVKISGGYKPPVTVIFKKKIYTLLLSPFSSRYIFIIILLLIIGALIYAKIST